MYPILRQVEQQVDLEIGKTLEGDVPERSKSNLLYPMVLDKKRNNEIRICLDMRNLNSIVKKSYDFAANVETLLNKCQGSNICYG